MNTLLKSLAVVLLVGAVLAPWAAVGASTPIPNIAGTWAQRQVQTSVADIAVIGEVESKTVSYVRMEIDQEGNKLRIQAKPCWIKVESEIEQVRTIIPGEMLDAIGTQKFDATLVDTPTSWEFYQRPTVAVLGAKLKNPWTEKLPTSPTDPRVQDVDKDGNPGVTVRVYGLIDGSIFLAQRSWSELRGKIKGSNIQGWVRWGTTQEILGATSGPLKSNPGARPHPDARKSHFQMTRIDPSMTCKEIIIKHTKLFKM